MTADGDLNIFGYDVDLAQFLIFDKTFYKSGDKVRAYSFGNYPISDNINEKKAD